MIVLPGASQLQFYSWPSRVTAATSHAFSSSFHPGFGNIIYMRSCLLRSGKSQKLNFFQRSFDAFQMGKQIVCFILWLIDWLMDCNFSFHLQALLVPLLHVWMVAFVQIKGKNSNVHVLKITMVIAVKLKVIIYDFYTLCHVLMFSIN